MDLTKKISLILSVAILMGLIFVVPASFAKNVDNPEIVFTAKEIKDKDKLFERAQKGITDINAPFRHESKVVNVKTKKEGKVDIFSTTQKLEEKKYADGKTVTTYATTNFAAVAELPSKYDYDYDGSYGVKAYNTIYWQKSTDPNGLAMVKLYKAEGGWQILDSQLSLSDREVILASSGNGGWGWIEQVHPVYPAINTFSYTTPSDWDFVLADINTQMGCIQNVTIHRGTSSWDFSFMNSY